MHQLCIGDRENDAGISDLIDTAQLQGYAEPKDLMQMIADAWTYYHVTLLGNMRVNEGVKNSETLSWSYNYDWDGDEVRTKLEIPGTVAGTTRLNNCMQNWYGEYYLPDKEHKTTFVIVTHEENLIEHCEQVIRLKDGEIVIE